MPYYVKDPFVIVYGYTESQLKAVDRFRDISTFELGPFVAAKFPGQYLDSDLRSKYKCFLIQDFNVDYNVARAFYKLKLTGLYTAKYDRIDYKVVKNQLIKSANVVMNYMVDNQYI